MGLLSATAPQTRPSLRRALISVALDATSAVRTQLLRWKGDDYALTGTEPVLDVPQSGNCWVVDGRHGRTLVSRTLPIWDVDGIDPYESDEEIVARFRDILWRYPGCSFRLYRTLAGVRLICTSRAIDLNENHDLVFFLSVGTLSKADPIYVKLCQQQRTCRARLDPKKSRQGVLPRPENARACRLLSDDIGNGSADPALMAQVNFHDRASMALFGPGRELF